MTFTAPTTYTEAKALMGTDIETPLGALRCSGSGLRGVDGSGRETFSLNFHNDKGNVAISWDSQNGWVTEDERKAATWTAKWDKLPTNARKLITLVLGHYGGSATSKLRETFNIKPQHVKVFSFLVLFVVGVYLIGYWAAGLA